MLVLSRQLDEKLVIQAGGEEITITVTQILGSRVKLGIAAPASAKIYRQEVLDKIRQEGPRRDP